MNMRARDLIASVAGSPSRTAERWRPLAGSAEPITDWAEFLVLALRHRVTGIAHDALAELGWLDRLPVTVYEELVHWSEVAELRQLELEVALAELAETQPAAVAGAVLLKGAALRTEYPELRHRLMADFDMLFSAEDFEAVEPEFERLGYWRKESLNGPTYYREGGRSGRLSLDVHVLGPSKYHRPDSALEDTWLRHTEPFTVGSVQVRRMTADHAFVNVVSHAHEHLGSWIHGLADDDVRLIRFIDAELLLAGRPVDVAASWRLATELDLHGEFALGLWAWREVRGELPAVLAPLAEAVSLVDDLGDVCALPGGGLSRWSVPLRDRAFLVDRTDLAFDLLPEGSVRRWKHWQEWYRTEGMLPDKRELVELISEQARKRLTGFRPAAVQG